MSRQSTDLLDVFRSPPARSSGGGARAVVRPRGGEGRAAGLPRRQVVLGACALALVVVLAFVAGVAVGRTRGARASSPALASRARRDTVGAPVYAIRTRPLPQVGIDATNLEEKARKSFAASFPDLYPFLEVVPVEDGKGRATPGQFAMVVRGFEGRKSAEDWRRELAVWNVEGYLPFSQSAPYPLN